MSLETLFDRYRRKGDASALAKVFDRVAPRLLRVARHLARDEAEAEDLVQATFVEAIDHADRFDAARPLVPWLVGILNNKARQAGDGAVPVHEGADRPGRLDPVEAAEVSEFTAALERALRRVPDSYRRVVRIHIAEGRAPEEIARELGLRPGTVRVQLHRGLKHLRRLLPAGFGLGGEVVKPPARGLDEVRAVVMASANSAVPMAAVSTTVLLEGALMTKKIIAAVAALALLAVPTWIWIDRDSPSSVEEEPEAAAVIERDPPVVAEREDVETVAPEAAASERHEVDVAEVAEDEPYGSLEVEFVWWDGSPAAGIGVQVVPFGERQPSQHALRTTADLGGRVVAMRMREGEVMVTTDRGSQHVLRVERGAGSVERIEIPRGVDAVGRVVDESGRPVTGAGLWVAERPTLIASAWRLGDSQADGRFFLRSVDPGASILATAARLGSSESIQLRGESPDANGAVLLELVVRGASAALDGTVVDTSGEPLPGAVVAVRVSTQREGVLVSGPIMSVVTDEKGYYEFDGLLAGWTRAWAVENSHALKEGRVELLEGRVNRLDFRLGRGFAVEGSLVSSQAVPEHATLELERDYLESALQRISASINEQGEYRVENLPPGEITLTVRLRGDGERRSVNARLSGVEGQVLHHDFLLDRSPSLRGRAVDELGRPIAGWKVRVTPMSRQASPGAVTTDEDGRFAVTGLLDERHDVSLSAPGRLQHMRAFVEGVLPDGADIELIAPSTDEPSAHLTGRVIGLANEVVRPQSIWARRDDGFASIGNPTYNEDGGFRIGPMPPGTYQLSISMEDSPNLTVPHISVEPDQLVELGEIRLEQPGNVELVFRRTDGEPLKGASAYLLSELKFGTVLRTEDRVTFRAGPMNPGTYTVSLVASNAASILHVVEVLPGETTFAEFEFPPGRRVSLWVRVPEGERLPRRVRVVVRNPAGDAVFDREGYRTEHDGKSYMALMSGFVEGLHTYTAESANGWRAQGSFHVDEGLDQVEIELTHDG